jgi:hypothetical protein
MGIMQIKEPQSIAQLLVKGGHALPFKVIRVVDSACTQWKHTSNSDCSCGLLAGDVLSVTAIGLDVDETICAITECTRCGNDAKLPIDLDSKRFNLFTVELSK